MHLGMRLWGAAVVTAACLLSALSDVKVAGQTVDVCASCHANATCEDKPDGSGKVCNCMYGFVGNGRVYCQDKDECQIGATKICGPHTSCHNTYGSYYCTCQAGYSPSNSLAIFIPNDGTHCQDIDECRIPGICGEGGQCKNLQGGFNCHCQVGYKVQNGIEPFHPRLHQAFCKAIDCGHPPSVEDAVQLSGTGTQYGSVARFGCQDGFLRKSGDDTSACGLDGRWTGPSLVCEAKCGPAPHPVNSEVVWHNRSAVLYSCLKGHRSWKGSSMSVCDDTGKWLEATMRCREIKPAISELAVFNDKCLSWKAEKYEEDTENYRVVFSGFRSYQKNFRDKRKTVLSSDADQLEVCLDLLPVTNYTIAVTAVSVRSTSTVSANTSLQVPQAPEVFYREFETPHPTLWLRRTPGTLDPISHYQVFVLPLEGTLVFDCASLKNPDFLHQRGLHGQYITAQVHLKNVGREMNFSVGDGRYYGEYYNAPLLYGTDYYVILRAVSQWKGAVKYSCVLWAKVKGTSYVMMMSAVFVGAAIGLFATVVIVGYLYTTRTKTHSCFRRSQSNLSVK